MDLLDWHRGTLSSRRVLALIKNLPQDSAVQRELHGESAEWSITDHLLAATVDHLAVANWMFLCVNGGEDGDQPDPPEPVPRPGGPDRDDDGADTDENGRSARAEESTDVSPHALARFFG
ncbi:hypothetical protein [Streptomyces sp. NBC_00572]|uniref:hypothetical protein n=1 Tax=Streptomyces sp. NBC_00572 TaxID=2903664 RepID=UPI00225360DE|nr:hypothetical protein [Streptomyces sp. NBC_00572]MCX4982815.1 DUF5361 domain-containing protein [Streptomyces sp. NBC_00572]